MSDLETLIASYNPWWSDSKARPPGSKPARRHVQKRVLSQITDEHRHLLLMGPRQVGKTTVLKQTVEDLLDAKWPAPNVTYFDFSDERAARIPARRILELEPPGGSAQDHPRVLLLDEITHSQGRWDLWMKQEFDHGPGHRIVATDSRMSLLRTSKREAGTGRWDEFLLEGLTFREFLEIRGTRDGSPHRLEPRLIADFLAFGGFPEHALGADNRSLTYERIREAIVSRAIYRDLSDQIDTSGASELFAVLAELSGLRFSVKNWADRLRVNERTIKNWLDKFQLAGLVHLVGCWGPSVAKRSRKQKKVHVFDHGLAAAFSSEYDPLSDSRVRARVYENAVYRELRDRVPDWWKNVTYYRENKKEVDFIVQTRRGPIAIEVTSAGIGRRKVRGLEEIARKVGAKRAVVVHGGLEDDASGPVRLIPLPKFLLDSDSVLGAPE